MPFVKLDCGLLQSSLWLDKPARDVFITALLMAVPKEFKTPSPQIAVDSLEYTGWVVPPGKYGFVSAAGPGIVHQALVDRPEGMAALKMLGEPDAESRSQAFDGRRLIRVDHGFIVLNYQRFRDNDGTAAERNARYRERLRGGGVTGRDATVTDRDVTRNARHSDAANRNVTRNETQAEAEVEAEADQDLDPGSVRIETNPEIKVTSVVCVPRKNRSATDLPYSAAFERFWKCYPNKTGKGKAWTVWQRIKPDLQLAGKFEDAIAWQITQPQWQKDGGQFIPHAATWLNQKRWQDEPFNPPVDDFDAMFDAVAARIGVR
jgi:hypothetical protein